MRPRHALSVACFLAGLPFLAGLYGCGGSDTGSTGPDLGSEAKLRLTAVVAGTPVAIVSAEVIATDIVTPLRFNLPIVNGVASGTCSG
jgi:hypothetical protein